MAGLKIGSKVLQIDGIDRNLIAELAKVVGLSGHACALVREENQAKKFTRAAAMVGVFVKITVAPLGSMPYEANFFDLVVIKNILGEMHQNDRVICLQQVYEVLRIGGRCLVIEQAARGGLGALWSKQSLDSRYTRGGAQAALKAEGFQGVRLLGERDSMSFTEGTKGTKNPDL